MPIYPIKGSTASAIQAINAGNATVSHRVARVNGFDGTAGHLIYTAEQDVFNYGATPYGWGGYSSQGISEWARVNGDRIDVGATGTGFSRVYTNSPISLSGYSTLNMYVYTNDATYVHGPYGIELLNNITDMSTSGPRAAYAEKWSSANTASTYQTVSLSLAGYNTGSYYIGVFCNATDSAGNGGVGIKAYRIWLT